MYESHAMSVEDYVAMMSAGAYSAILNDGAMLQISFDFLGDDMVGQRLAYLPCPYRLDPQIHLELGTLGAIEVVRLDESQRVILRGPVRFDYDPDSASLDHPESHMTIGADSCRIPITRPITLGHFVRFVFRHFYPYLHRVHDVLATWRIGGRTGGRRGASAKRIALALEVTHERGYRVFVVVTECDACPVAPDAPVVLQPADVGEAAGAR